MMADRKLKLGIAGLGRGFTVMLPTLALHPMLDVVAAVDTRKAALDRFEADFGGAAYGSVDAMCAHPGLDAVYVATPHQFHAEHTEIAAQAGKHILVEKPMALTLEDCTRMIDAAARARVHLLVGHSHSYDAPIAEARRLIASGAYGTPRLITGMNYTDFIYRPRRPEELDTARGGGVVFSQAAHQIDIARLLGGGLVETVYATTGSYDPARPTEGAYTAILKFADGAVANLTYSGYGRFDTDEFCGWRAESGAAKNPETYGAARRALREIGSPGAEAALKAGRAYGGPAGAGMPVAAPSDRSHEHFGLFVVSCDGGDIRPMPDGVLVYADDARKLYPLPAPAVPRTEVIDELYASIVGGAPPVHTGEWGRATLEVCCAVLQSAQGGGEVRLAHQVAVGDAVGDIS
jgi:phthalate 4,5-cis-dihydrodiol dehydrogenase